MSEEEPLYYKIFHKYFSENAPKSPELMKNAFGEILHYLDGLNKILMTGTEEQKKKALIEYKELRKLVQEQVEKFKAERNLSDQDFQKMLKDPSHYKEEDWEVIQESVKEMKSIPGLQKNLAKAAPPKKAKKSSKKSKDKWLKT